MPHTPLRQENGISRPARCAASSTASFGSQGKRNSVFWTETLKAIASYSGSAISVSMREESHTTMRLTEFQIVARGADQLSR